MVTKLTLTIEGEVIQSAKKYAQEQGRSLSDVVETYLKTLSDSSKEYGIPSKKISGLRGVIKLSKDFDYKAELGRILHKKFSK